MIKDNPDDTVREEQNEVDMTASGTENALDKETAEAAKDVGDKEEDGGEAKESGTAEKDQDEVTADDNSPVVEAEGDGANEAESKAKESETAEKEQEEVTADDNSPVVEAEGDSANEAESKAKESETAEKEQEEVAADDNSPVVEAEGDGAKEANEADAKAKESETAEKDQEKVTADDNSPVVEAQGDGAKEAKEAEVTELPPVDYSGFSKNELVETLGLNIDNRPPSEIREDVERIKALFYKKIRQESEERKTKFLEGGGKIEDYKIWVDPLDYQVKELLDKYREKKNDYSRVQEAEKYDNLKRKYDIIDKIKDLVNREESINKTFHDFRSLQNEWHSIGVVPQASLKDLWENYHHSVEIFYDYIKINKELRDLDLKKNLELKVLLCEKAEELMLEPNPVNAFRILQDFHDQWREIGPVPPESKNEIWERFKEATSLVNKRHHEYFEKQKDEQRKNLEAKIALCEEVEAINILEMKNFRDFDEKAEKIVSLQKMWRTIGFAPKKQNNKVYQRFREACDVFFEKKRTFYADNKETQLNNLQLKTELCVQAEALQESTDWKATTDALIRLQREWKEVGPVPRKLSDKTWKRFRKACDHFFNKKAEHFSSLDSSYVDNLKAKITLIEELEKFEPGNDVHVAFERLKDLQRRWTEIGFVPFNKKEEITNRYRNALNKEFDKLKIADEDKTILKYRTKLDNLKANPKASRKVHNERDKFFIKIKQLEGDIVLWENNIGFFAKSANAETMIREVQNKIESAKKMIKMLEEKVRIIDQSGLDD